jgi:hypothetical protein
LQSRQTEERQRRKRKGIPQGLVLILENSRDPLVKKNLTIVLELKQKCDQNKSCTTFQALQLCLRV